jgi:transcriptional regulator with PAS, ATPase and Fis domain
MSQSPMESGPTSVLSSDDPMVCRARVRDAIVALRNVATGEDLEVVGDRRWVLGSKPACDLILRDAWVSGFHCVLERRAPDAALVVRDRASRNGTYVNGIPVEAAVLRPGSLIVVGKTTLVAVAEAGRRRRSAYEQLRGSDPGFRRAVEIAMRAAQTDCSVLIVGETGTGKDLLARAIHEASSRAVGPYVPVNCGAIPRELIGSELFGHERGAFTGAINDRDGYFVEANAGTLFLDELAELPLEQQPHLLRVLETHSVRRIGGAVERATDVRIVAATNRLEGLGTPMSRLRLDLFHRIATVVVPLPPLRERPGDVRELAVLMMADLAPQFGAKHVTPAAWSALRSYDWPGNVRELSHAVSRAMALGGEALGPLDFLPDITGMRRAPMRALHADGGDATPPDIAADVVGATDGPLPAYASLLRDAMIDALARYQSIRRAAQHLGMPKSTFADKARAWGLLTPRSKK